MSVFRKGQPSLQGCERQSQQRGVSLPPPCGGRGQPPCTRPPFTFYLMTPSSSREGVLITIKKSMLYPSTSPPSPPSKAVGFMKHSRSAHRKTRLHMVTSATTKKSSVSSASLKKIFFECVRGLLYEFGQ